MGCPICNENRRPSKNLSARASSQDMSEENFYDSPAIIEETVGEETEENDRGDGTVENDGGEGTEENDGGEETEENDTEEWVLNIF
ncbi:hypothetical protein DdX_12745 [Ditylenchus destructor]|uniref:Uncharacterized protein n=1 Tax=Ditylenchus destructor TaxID=166010 RepID=A0AAD4R389_9BILA|nr:hypothetical protein DdX_12745 [Ditylenchus destructor]